MSHSNCTVNNAYSSLDSNQGFSPWYGIISLLLYIETIKNVVNSIEQKLIMRRCVQTVCTVECGSYRFNIPV